MSVDEEPLSGRARLVIKLLHLLESTQDGERVILGEGVMGGCVNEEPLSGRARLVTKLLHLLESTRNGEGIHWVRGSWVVEWMRSCSQIERDCHQAPESVGEHTGR